MSVERSLLAAQGYIELGMPEDALRELDEIPASEQDSEEVQQTRLFVFIQSHEWEKALKMCDTLREAHPDNTSAYVHGAFCLHELKRTDEARAYLLAGPAELLHDPTYHYNLACYDAVLGHLDEARQHLRTSIQMDKKFRAFAKDDPDLKALQG